jgi:plastocyanin
MFFSVATLSLALFAASASAETHYVKVGGDNLVFSPEAIFANVGDQVVFEFHAKNHSVTQSSLAKPCSKADGGFDSGLMPVAANQTDNFPTYTITVNDTKPIWAYCKQGVNTAASHCGKGMIFSVNCGPDGAPNSFQTFKAEALAIGSSLAAAAATASPSGSATTAPAAASGTETAAYGDVTIPPAPTAVTVTQTVAVASSTWTTTYASYPNSPDPTPNAAPAVIKVVVGGSNSLTFDPPHVSAKPKDIISFQFASRNHTVTQSSFADPCRRFTDPASGQQGFDSGFQFVAEGTAEDALPVWNYTVETTAPLWAYCKQKTPASHCGAGMVFAINSDETSQRSFAAFQQLAKQLNGTAAAASTTGSASASAPSTTSKDNGAAGIGSSALTVALGALAAVVLSFA